ncbi:lipopolysaccharide transport periplasmic protein LptA [Rhodanobacter sp. DHB23]|uniref:lipopolysaccharide transport periplasmic protein LptA n=1 Tax=Rhodanobacter sp. DHB23 TaxID=2775923 RepID=UPI001CE10283|nr:lipopolysaccharide transport periplasmic protein LptA [Rhodanobacter sp. DHB23]
MQATVPSRRVRARNASRDAIGMACVAALLALAPLAASAKKSDRQQVMNYAARHTDAYNAPNTVTTLTGNVRITQGTMLVTGDVAKIYLDGDQQVSRVVVTGKPAHIQELDENNNLMTGDGTMLDYDNTNSIAVLTGNAVVNQQCRGEFHGDKLTYNQDTSQITGDTAGDGLVHGVILPKNTTATPVVCARPPTAQPVPDNEPVAGRLPAKAVTPAPAKTDTPAKGH